MPRTVLPTSPDPRVSILVVAFRSRLLPLCLRALAAHAPPGLAFEVVAILNEGTAEDVAELEREFAGVRFVRSMTNRGLAGAANLARSLASGEFLFLLHDDSEIEAGCLEALLSAAREHPEAGALGCLVLEPEGRVQGAGQILWRDGLTSPPWEGEPPPTASFAEGRAVDYVGTSAMLVRASTWDAFGGLDERFYPGYYVDVDAAMAIRQLGQIVWCEPRARCRHRRGASSSPRFRVFVSERNRAAFLTKWRAALERQEPRADGPEALARALARAEVLRQDVLAGTVSSTGESSAPISRLESDYVAKELALQRDFAKWLSSELERAEELLQEVPKLHDVVNGLRAELAARRPTES